MSKSRSKPKALPQKIVKGTRLVGADREQHAAQLREQYDSGMSIRAIAQQHGRSYGAVHRVLAETGVDFRSRGGARVNAGGE